MAKQQSVGQIQYVWPLVAILAGWSFDAAAQSAATSKSQDAAGTKKWSPSRTAWGDPDLQGILDEQQRDGRPPRAAETVRNERVSVRRRIQTATKEKAKLVRETIRPNVLGSRQPGDPSTGTNGGDERPGARR